MSKTKIVNFSQLKAHDNLSAEFWVNHDETKCKLCKNEKIKWLKDEIKIAKMQNNKQALNSLQKELETLKK